MNGAELFVKCLENEGVDLLFGLPGEENLEILDALSSTRIRPVITRDERGAAFMANALGRLTGSPGVCLSTLGPGATNLVTGIADAYLDFAPLLAVTAQASARRMHKESHQYIDILSMLRPITKWNTRVESPVTIPEVVRKAFKKAVWEKKGPVHIEVPEDMAAAEVDGEPLNPAEASYPIPPEKEIRKAVELIREASMPLILAGNGVLRNRAAGELLGFARKAGIAVINTFMGLGAVPADDELFISTIGLQSRDYVQCGIDRADLIIAVGYDHVEFSPRYWNYDKKIIHIDTTPAEVDAAYSAFELVGDIGMTLRLMADLFESPKDPSYCIALKRDLRETRDAILHHKGAGAGVNPLRVVMEMRACLNRDDILVSDVGAHKIWISRFYEAYEPDTVLISNGLASMGFAIPGAVAAKLRNPERNVIAATGDGGFLMSVGEIETAVRNRAAIVVLIFNDNGYGLIRWKEEARYRRNFLVDLGNPDFVRLAESFGCKGYRVDHGDRLQATIQEALKNTVPSIIDCSVDYSINRILTERLGQIVCGL
ncbi:MAG: acetolactate synthase large subunit [Thermodesulfovibrionales bacterium]|jgi:acetolactate synthase-1/2/3 large subunit